MKLPNVTADQSLIFSSSVYPMEREGSAEESARLRPASHGRRKICKYYIGYKNKGKNKTAHFQETLDRSVQHPQGYQDDDSICEAMAIQTAQAYQDGSVKSFSVYTQN